MITAWPYTVALPTGTKQRHEMVHNRRPPFSYNVKSFRRNVNPIIRQASLSRPQIADGVASFGSFYPFRRGRERR